MSNENAQVGQMTLEELLSLESVPVKSREGRSRTTSAETYSKHGSASRYYKMDSMKVVSIPPLPPKTDQEKIKTILAPLRGARKVMPIGALHRDVLDVRASSIKQKKLASFSTNEMTFSNFGKDGEFINVAKQFPRDEAFTDEEEEAYVEALLGANAYIGSSGNMQGLLTRLVTGLLEPKVVPVLSVAECTRWARKAVKYRPVDVVFSGRSLAEVIADLKGEIKFNPNSNAGVPYYCKLATVGTMRQALEVGSEMLDAIAEGKFEAFVENRPSLMAVLLKNKQDYYKVENLANKIRPYFVYPLHERLLYSALHCKLKAVRFDEDYSADMASAVGFSWNYGGGDRMYDWIVAQTRKGEGFYSTFYGDDQLWVIVGGGSHSTYIVTPDFSHMDLSLAPQWGQVAYSVWRGAFKHFDNTWDAVLKLNCKRAFVRPVIVDGALTFNFKYGLGSGIPGTTKFDEIASATVNGYVSEMFEARKGTWEGIEQLLPILMQIKKDVERKFGLVFKDGTLQPTPFVEGSESYDFVFLGQKLIRMHGERNKHYVPKPELVKLMLSATTFKKSYKSPLLRQKAAMQKFRSLYAMGGYLYPILADRLHAQYISYEKRSIRPMLDDDPEFVTETESNVFLDIPFSSDDVAWPTSEWSANLFLPPDDSLTEHSGIAMSERMSESNPTHAYPEDEDDDLGFEDFVVYDEEAVQEELEGAANPTDWGAQIQLERSGEDVGSIQAKEPSEVPMRGMAQTQPLSDAAKKAFEEKAEADRAMAKAMARPKYTSGGAVKPKKTKVAGKGKRSGALGAEDFEAYDEEGEDVNIGHF